MARKIHLISGLVMMLLFLLSGQYLNFVLPPLNGTLDGNSMMYRANHVYLMMAAAINMACGIYYTAFIPLVAAWLQRIGATLVIGSQPLLLAAFLIEPGNNTPDRIYTQLGSIMLFIGISLTFIASLKSANKES